MMGGVAAPLDDADQHDATVPSPVKPGPEEPAVPAIADITDLDGSVTVSDLAGPVDLVAVDAGTTDAAAPEAEAEEDELFTIDELAAETGVPSRTIRFYQSKGTLPAPERRGRVAYYKAEHVERLKVIAELQDRGLRLDAIRDALQQVEQGGDSLQAWLGMGDTLQAPWSDDQPIVLTEDELFERVGGHRPGMIAELRNNGMIERQGNSRPATYIVPSPGLLDIGIQLDRAGVDASIGYEAATIMRNKISRMADELVDFFAERAGQGFAHRGEPEDVARAFEALRPEGMRAVQLIFAQEIERSLRTFVERGGAMPPARKPRKGDEPSRSERRAERERKRTS
jgi:DNA-binding transcriptional MerR regulator